MSLLSNRFAISVCACSFAVALTADVIAGGTAEYEFIIIEPWDTSYSLATSSVTGLNNLNQVSGAGYRQGGSPQFLWTYEDGKQDINFAGHINDLGYIASSGAIRKPDGTILPFSGQMGGVGELNNNNMVAGSTGGVHTCPKHPAGREAAVWTESGGTIRFDQDLGLFGSDQLWGLNDNGEVVGVSAVTGECGDHKAFYYNLNTDTYIYVHSIVAGTPSGITRLHDINNNGIVTGDGPVNGPVHPFTWSIADGVTILPTLPSADPMYTHPVSINDNNVIVGSALSFEDDWEWYAVIWDENGVRNLNDLVDELPPNFIIEEAKKINNNGWIIGRGHYGVWSPERAVVLVPIPDKGVASDLNNDEVVDVFDLFMLLGNWGTNGMGADLAAPLDLVDVFDLFELLSNWG